VRGRMIRRLVAADRDVASHGRQFGRHLGSVGSRSIADAVDPKAQRLE
jgi:hypothetical protein